MVTSFRQAVRPAWASHGWQRKNPNDPGEARGQKQEPNHVSHCCYKKTIKNSSSPHANQNIQKHGAIECYCTCISILRTLHMTAAGLYGQKL